MSSGADQNRAEELFRMARDGDWPEEQPQPKPQPYGWHWMLVHEKSGEVCNEGFTANRPGCVPPPPRMKAPGRLRGFAQIGVPVYKETHVDGVVALLVSALARAEDRREGAIDMETVRRALHMLRFQHADKSER